MNLRPDFRLETLVDFPDDVIGAAEPITAQHIDALMAALKACGISRVSWCDYGDGHGGYLLPDFQEASPAAAAPGWRNYGRTLQLLKNPLAVATQAAHRHGLELYAYYKPYETGPAVVFPEGSLEARLHGRLPHIGGRLPWLDRFVVDNPNLRIQRRTDDLRPGTATPPIYCLQLRKSDDAPTRITAKNLQIWVSDLNYEYRRLDVPFHFEETTPIAARDVHDWNGRRLTSRGDTIRVLTLSGLCLTHPYVLVTTDIAEGSGDFENAGTELLQALDGQGKEILGTVATSTSIWRGGKTDFQNSGLDFDTGLGNQRICLDAAAPRGFIAFAHGRNAFLPGALCETEPAVSAYWLRWISELLDAGVDGIDLREENHSTHTDYPEDYGYNPAVLEKCAGEFDAATIARVRGDAYTQFLREAKQLCASRGKRLRINFQIDWYRPAPPRDRALAFPANIDFQWQRWIEEKLLDEATMRFYALPSTSIHTDAVAIQLTQLCRRHSLPLSVNRYVTRNDDESLQDTLERVRHDANFAGFIFYETANFAAFEADGNCRISEKVMPRVSS